MNSIMKTLDNIIDTVKNFVKANKKLFFLIIGVIVVLIGFSVYKNIQKSNIDKIPIKSIKVTCDHEFKIDSKLSNGLDYFTVTAVREGGVESELDSSNLKLSQDFVNPYGKTTKMEASYDVNGKEYKCNVEVPNERKKVIGFQCGYPNVKDVVAVLYSNGELAFEGEGDTLVFYENEYPWLTNWWEEAGVDEEKVPSIKSVTFDSKVKPTNLNYAFEGLQHLVYVGKIPDSIRTMVSTFAGCTSLKNAADLSSASILLNMNYTYEGCSELVNANIIPENVRVSKATFRDCSKLQLCADMSKAEKLVIIDSMYENCQSLSSVTLRDGITSMRYTFSECINLKQLSDFPTTVKHMEGTFSGAVSLSKFDAIIPDTVQELNQTFKNCELLAGQVQIDCNVENFEEIFTGACQATKVNLVGNSMLLDAYANTCDMDNVYVNGIKPNTAIQQYGDIFEQ